MEIQNIKTNQIHIVDEILNVDNIIVYFTEDKFCFPSTEVKVLNNESYEKKLSECEVRKIINDWVEKRFGTKEDKVNWSLFSEKNKLGFISKPKFINKFLCKFFKKVLYIEDNSVIDSRSKIFPRKVNLFTLNKKEYYLLDHRGY